jgi:TolB-like protein
MQDLIAELKRRHVFRVGIAYAIVAWVLVQVVVSVKEPLRLPDWADTLTIVFLGVGFVVALILAWAFEKTPDGIRRTESVATQNAAAAGVDDDVASIAVLPFADMSPDHDQEYFADGITEELLNSLARIRDLRVSGRTSSFYFKGRNEDLRSIGNALGVGYILEGSVRKAGDRVRITAQLINTATDAHLWSETYDRTLEDLFEIQEDIAKSVASALQITLGVGGLGGIPGMTRNAAAYDEYLRAGVANGVDMILPTSIPDIRRSAQHLERAVTIDPDFSLAWAGLQYLYGSSAAMDPSEQAQKVWAAKSREAGDHALALTPDSPILLSNLCWRKADEVDWPASENYYRQAMDAATRYAMTEHLEHRAGMFMHMLGRLDEAIDHYERGRLSDPLNAQIAAYLSDAYLARGDVDLALAEADRFRDYNGPTFVLAKASGLMAAMMSGDRAELDSRLAQLSDSDPDPSIAIAMRDRRDNPEEALAELKRMLNEPRYQSAFQRNIIAIWAAHLGAPELALKLLHDFLVRLHNGRLAFLAWRGVFRDLRRLPAFKDLLRDLRLVDYWRQTGDWGYFCRPLGDDDFECYR